MTLLINTVLALLSQYVLIMAQSEPRSYSFARNLLSVISEEKTTQNVVYSPASIRSALALTFLAAEGHTGEEIRHVLNLDLKDKVEFAKKYGHFLKSTFNKTEVNAPQLIMVNRLYVNSKLSILPKFNELASKYLGFQAENVDFSQASRVVNKINKLVEEQTNNKIKNLLRPDAVNDETSVVLLNAIYFKAKWLKPFSVMDTHKSDFHINENQVVKMDTMYADEIFRYMDCPDLQARALEIPYNNSDISMLIILPDKLEGLKLLLNKLKTVSLIDMTSKMERHSVQVFLPKFRIEFDVDMRESLAAIGCSSMFSHGANLNGIFKSDNPQRVSDFKHKAFLDVNEGGSEAAAVSFLKITPMSFNFNAKIFRVDRPFVFVIRSENEIYFTGHVLNF